MTDSAVSFIPGRGKDEERCENKAEQFSFSVFVTDNIWNGLSTNAMTNRVLSAHVA